VTLTETEHGEPIDVGHTVALAQFNAQLTRSEIPETVAHQAKRALVDHLAVAFAGSAEPASVKLRSAAARLAPSDQATIIGSRQRTSAPFAALLNGHSSHVLDYDDTYNPGRTTIHGSSSVWPVIFALSELARLDGRSALESYVAGFETEARVADAAGPAHYDIGWHVTGTAGHLGGAAAAAKVLGLSAEQTVNALGCAATQAAGLKEVYGSDCKPLHPGKSAMDGLLAGVLASEGFTSRTTSLEGKQGLLRLMSTDPDPDLLVKDLHSFWHLAQTGFKAYPSGSLTHPAVDCLLDLHKRHGLLAHDVESVQARVHRYAATVTGNANPTTSTEAKFSLAHCVAIALLKHRLIPADFDTAVVNDAVVTELRSRVQVSIDPDVGKRGASVTVRLRDGRMLESAVTANRGTPDNPMRDEDLEKKFLSGAVGVVGEERAKQMLEHCWGLENLDDLSLVVKASAGTF
jgi:2-methylcitrate dehydratase PrpD